MKKSFDRILFTILCILSVAVMGSCENECVQGQLRACSCPSGAQGQQICLNYKGDWEECKCKGEPMVTDTESEMPTDTSIDGGSTDDIDSGVDTEEDTTDEDTGTQKEEDTTDEDTGTQNKEDAGDDASI